MQTFWVICLSKDYKIVKNPRFSILVLYISIDQVYKLSG